MRGVLGSLLFIFVFISSVLCAQNKRCDFYNKKADYLSISAGCFDFMREHHRTAEFRLEYKPYALKKLRPFLGVLGTAKASFYIYFGVGLELFFSKNIYFSPNLAAGYYLQGKGKDLGYPLEFKSAIEFGWQFENQYRISAAISHISNASFGNKNPGQESLVITFSIPFRKSK